MISQKEYSSLVQKKSPASNIWINCMKAFLIGGAICTVGQALKELYLFLGINEKNSSALCSVSLIFLGILLTALHIYDNVAKHAGAGTLVPITGFANSIASPAIEFKTEGFITGLGAKMFIISGPVLVYGTASAVLYGTVYYIFKIITG